MIFYKSAGLSFPFANDNIPPMLPIAAVGEIPRSSRVLTKAIVFPISPRLPVHDENSNDAKTTKTNDLIFS